MYVEDADWHATISDLVAKARLVVLRPAGTEAVLCEARIVARVAGDKVALYVRDLAPGVWTGFASKLGDTLGTPLPPYPEPDAILLYIRGGTVHALRWVQPQTTGEQGRYVLTRSFVKPLFSS